MSKKKKGRKLKTFLIVFVSLIALYILTDMGLYLTGSYFNAVPKTKISEEVIEAEKAYFYRTAICYKDPAAREEIKNSSPRDPTHAEMRAFLKENKVNEREYVEKEYICNGFSYSLVLHALRKNIRAGYVYLELSNLDAGHAIVCFNTTDKGLIFIDPQTDGRVEVTVGEQYRKDNSYLQYCYRQFGEFKPSLFLYLYFLRSRDKDAKGGDVLEIHIFWPEDIKRFLSLC